MRTPMEDMGNAEDPHSTPSSSAKPRISYACEACRVGKVKCQPGTVEGICRRCAVSKRECVFFTGPRTRRRRSKLHPAAGRSTPPPSAPSKTFTIDVPMPAEEDVDDESSDIIQAHEVILQNLVDETDDVISESSNLQRTDTAPSLSSGSRAFSMSTPSVGRRSVHGFSSIQPQFNLDSAASLLALFTGSMLPWFPVIILPSDTSVAALAKERPFILLAILAAASGGKSLQGHNLYDEEFRKVLGLKFVSGGERSLELLIGLLIYCAWYPFHLRPKNKQAFQYVRMASDIVHDLELDQEPQDDIHSSVITTDPECMQNMRAYLAAQYLCSGFAATWQKTQILLPFQNWTATCCRILAGNDDPPPAATSNQTLAWLVRLQHFVAETAQLNRRGGRELAHEEQHALFVVKGMETQFREFQGQMSPEISSQPVLHAANLMTEIILYGFPLLKYPYERARKRDQSSSTAYHVDPERLVLCATLLRTWYDYILSIPPANFSHLPGVFWGHLVASIVIGVRLCFPIPNGCPVWDHSAARQILDFAGFLTRFSGTDGNDSTDLESRASSRKSTRTDVLSASKIVVDMVKRKYEARLAALEKAEATLPLLQAGLWGLDKSASNKCPMLDGSLDHFIQEWDERVFDPTGFPDLSQGVFALDTEMSAAPSGTGSQPLVFHDLWATMTMAWSQEGFGDADFGNT